MARRGFGNKTRYGAVSAVRGGASLRESAARGASHESVRRWYAAEGVAFI